MPNLIESLGDIIKGLFKAVFAVLETFISLIQTFVTELATLAQATVSFIFRNFFVLALLAGAFVAFAMLQQRNPNVRRNVDQLKKKA
ncbi:uncharacterized protein JCM6883_004269 [Sporobolomyces salmoneus]|uniref:uncharacterized protein n=1 Tax=Sporobolomyces salmoneus TaxID=183962 RepID=UPI00318128C2